MSAEERTGFRSLIYSGWHRPALTRIRRFLDAKEAALLTLIDVDSCEYCAYCKAPIALIETERTIRAKPKAAPVTAMLAKMAGISAYSVAYVPDRQPEACTSCGSPCETGIDIVQFTVRRIYPPDPWNQVMTPADYAKFLLSLRTDHVCAREDM